MKTVILMNMNDTISILILGNSKSKLISKSSGHHLLLILNTVQQRSCINLHRTITQIQGE